MNHNLKESRLKMKNLNFLKTASLFFLMSVFTLFSSCTKSADEVTTRDRNDEKENNPETSLINEKDNSESDSDITNVDYRDFYEQLAPHGEWVEVSYEEIGLKPPTANSGEENNFKIFSEIIGVKSAHAGSSAGAEMLFAWKPSVELSLKASEAELPVYVPYSYGQCFNSDAGWYFKGRTPSEEIVSHYGRWVNSPYAGWLWVPGRVWAPSWVDWKQNDTYVSWAPLPPSVYIANDAISAPLINDNYYLTVDRKYFLEPEVSKYNVLYYNSGVSIPVIEMKRTEGIVVVNSTIINRGPDVNIIQKIYGRNISMVKIQHSGNIREVYYNENEYKVYSPGFKKYKARGNSRVNITGPKSYQKYSDRKEINSGENDSYGKGKKNENTGNDNDNSNMNKGNVKSNVNKGNDNSNVNKGNDKNNVNKSNVKSTENKGNIKSNENKGNVQEKKNSGKENKNNSNSKSKENNGNDKRKAKN